MTYFSTSRRRTTARNGARRVGARGAVLAEAAIAIPILVFCILAAVQYAVIMLAQMKVRDCAEVGARALSDDLLRGDSGKDDLDASVLLAPRWGCVDARDERFTSTIDVIRRELGHGPFLWRTTALKQLKRRRSIVPKWCCSISVCQNSMDMKFAGACANNRGAKTSS